jgi:serine/threonine protein kinase
MTSSTLPPIQNYTLIEKLGEGTSGDVWKAENRGSTMP